MKDDGEAVRACLRRVVAGKVVQAMAREYLSKAEFCTHLQRSQYGFEGVETKPLLDLQHRIRLDDVVNDCDGDDAWVRRVVSCVTNARADREAAATPASPALATSASDFPASYYNRYGACTCVCGLCAWFCLFVCVVCLCVVCSR